MVPDQIALGAIMRHMNTLWLFAGAGLALTSAAVAQPVTLTADERVEIENVSDARKYLELNRVNFEAHKKAGRVQVPANPATPQAAVRADFSASVWRLVEAPAQWTANHSDWQYVNADQAILAGSVYKRWHVINQSSGPTKRLAYADAVVEDLTTQLGEIRQYSGAADTVSSLDLVKQVEKIVTDNDVGIKNPAGGANLIKPRTLSEFTDVVNETVRAIEVSAAKRFPTARPLKVAQNKYLEVFRVVAEQATASARSQATTSTAKIKLENPVEFVDRGVIGKGFQFRVGFYDSVNEVDTKSTETDPDTEGKPDPAGNH